MKTFYCSKHYDGNISLDIEAETKEEALKKFNQMVEKMEIENWAQFTEDRGLQDGRVEIYELQDGREVAS